jgi:hypothetical protein
VGVRHPGQDIVELPERVEDLLVVGRLPGAGPAREEEKQRGQEARDER